MKKMQKTVTGTLVVVPAVIGTVWSIRKLVSLADGALAPEEPEGGVKKKVVETVKDTASQVAEKAGTVASMVNKEKAEKQMEETMEAARETGESARMAAEAMTESIKTAPEMTLPGAMGWMRRNTRLALGLGAGTFAIMVFWLWRRGKKADLSDAGESVIERVGRIAEEAADMLSQTTGDIRSQAVEELEKQIDKLRVA